MNNWHDLKTGHKINKQFCCFSDAILPEIKYTKINITFTETFDVTFGKEGDKATLTCKMTINPNLANLQPEALWYRDGRKWPLKANTVFEHIYTVIVNKNS